MKNFLIHGSSHSDGHTMAVLENMYKDKPHTLIDLNTKNISPYDYENKNQDDDFLKIAQEMTKADVIVFATPVYWYSMSAQLKTFFDRFSDLITIRKDLGRALKGKKVCLVATGSDMTLPEGFEVPFKRTAEYLDMEYCGALYVSIKDGQKLSKNDIKYIELRTSKWLV